MFGKTIELPNGGILKRRWGNWRGELPVPSLAVPLDLRIEISRTDPIEPFARLAALFAEQFEKLKADFASELFDQYTFYKQADLEESPEITEADFAKHPPVNSPPDIWNVLTPFRLRLGSHIGKHAGNSYILVDVDWPNPHYFQVFMDASTGGFKYVHTELVG